MIGIGSIGRNKLKQRETERERKENKKTRLWKSQGNIKKTKLEETS